MHMHIQNLVVCQKKNPMENPVLVLAPFWTNILNPPPPLLDFFVSFVLLLFQNFVADKNK